MPHALVAGAKYALREKLADIQYWRRRRRHRHVAPKAGASGYDRKVVEELRAAGGYVSSLDDLGIPETAAMLSAADALFGTIANRAAGKGGFIASATAEEIDRYPDLIRWGLNERLLGIVENYICMPVDYRGLTARRDIVGGDQLETRLWHRDYEDFRIVKIIIYLNDVDRGGGDYEFIPRTRLPIWRVAQLGGRVEDPDMDRFVPIDARKNCSGPRGTIVFSDTCSVYHRGTIAHSEERRALFYCYNSRAPRSPQYCLPLFDRARFAKSEANLAPGQRAAIGE
jgi:hypothetical protein